MKLPYIMSWNITNKCNLRCTHCNLAFNHAGDDLPFEQVVQIIDKLAEKKVFILSFTGGEPFVRYDFMNIIKYAYSKHITSLIATNGLLLDKEKIEDLKNNGVSAIAVSLDSSHKEVHEQIRGEGTYDSAIHSIKLIKKAGIGLIISIAVSSMNFSEFGPTLLLAKNLGVDQVKVQVVVKEINGRYEMSLTKNELVSVIDICCKIQKEMNRDDFIKFTCYTNYLYYWLTDFDKPVCNDSKRRGIIKANGDIIMCELYPNKLIGNILEDDLAEIWEEKGRMFPYTTRQFTQPCSDCSNQSICRGGCKVFSPNSNINNPMFGDQNCPYEIYHAKSSV